MKFAEKDDWLLQPVY